MVAPIFLFLNLAASLFKPRWRLEAENAALRQQLIVLRRKVRGLRPETLVRWHRAGFRRYGVGNLETWEPAADRGRFAGVDPADER
jgi:hypothetical protein